MSIDVAKERVHLTDLQRRHADVQTLVDRIEADPRRLSTRLTEDDPLCVAANTCKTPVPHLCTRGTLLASALGHLEGVEMAIKSSQHALTHPDPTSYAHAMHTSLA